MILMIFGGQFFAASLLAATSSSEMVMVYIPFLLFAFSKVALPSFLDIRQRSKAISTQALQPIHFAL